MIAKRRNCPRKVRAAGGTAYAPNTVLRQDANAIAGRIRRGFYAIVADAGPEGAMTWHRLRHTCATWLMEAGVPVSDAAAFTGMTPSRLERHYGHHRARAEGPFLMTPGASLGSSAAVLVGIRFWLGDRRASLAHAGH